MNVVFLGTPHFAVPSLRRLAASRHRILAVVTNPDRPRGRGRHLAPPPAKEAALELGLPVLQPESPRQPGLAEQLAGLGADAFAVVAYSILPRRLLAVPPAGAVNLHPSLLPRYRGAAPIVWALFAGETETGITTFYLNPRVDAGDLLLQERVGIGPDETAGELEARLAELGADLVVRTFDGLDDGTLAPQPQSDAGATRAPKLSRQDGRLDWTWPAAVLHNRVRGANPVPGAYTGWRGDALKVHRSAPCDGVAGAAPGTVLQADGRDGLVVAAGRGALRLLEVQAPGKAATDGPAFVRGYRIAAGERLGEAPA
ncbi:MAG: methionyl-tRNA formyltransferase [Gemmatimonadota bacterium]